jgi:Protein kinase domain
MTRYRVDEPLPSESARPSFSGTDQQTERRVLVCEISAAEAEAQRGARGVEHAHLATLLDVVETDGGGSAAVSEFVPGVTLAERLAAGGHKTHVDAVRSALRVADALSHLHDAGGIHGAVRPEAVIVEPQGRAAPVLAYAPSLVGASPFRSPERGVDGPPSVADDTWAVASLLYEMLVGRSPPEHGVASEAELVEAGVTDELLRQALHHSLHHDVAERSSDLRPLKRELARWFVDHAGDDASPHSEHSHPPPPLPPGSTRPPVSGHVPAVASSMPPARGTRARRLIPLFAVLAVGAGVGAAYGLSSLRHPKPPLVARAPVKSKPAAPKGSAKEINLGEVPVTAHRSAMTGNKTAACVAGFLPKDAFKEAPDVDWLCTETDPRAGAEKLRTEVVKGGAGRVTDAMKLFSRLGWYDMAVYAAVQSGCCASTQPLSLPAPSQGCASMSETLSALGHAVATGQKHDAALAAYTANVECEIKANQSSAYRHKELPEPANTDAFEAFAKTLQSP